MNREDELGERSMMGVIALLTGKAYQQARVIQRWLHERHGILQPTFYQPHITFVIGRRSSKVWARWRARPTRLRS